MGGSDICITLNNKDFFLRREGRGREGRESESVCLKASSGKGAFAEDAGR